VLDHLQTNFYGITRKMEKEKENEEKLLQIVRVIEKVKRA